MTGSHDDEPDDPIMRSMRSVWVSMRDEEPPSKGLTELLAAARSKAEEMQPKESWWRRAMATLLRPPVLAVATVVVLISGAVVISKRSSDLEVDPVGSHATAIHTEQQKPEFARPEQEDRFRYHEATPVTPSLPEPTTKPVAPSKPPIIQRQGSKLEPRPERAKLESPDPRVTVDDRGGSPVQVGRGSQSTGDTAPGGLQIAEGTAPTADAQIKQDPTKNKTAEAPRNIDDTSHMRGPTTISVDQLVKQAEVAADRKDCPAVRVTAERIKKLDANAYKERIAKQAAIARCLK